MSRLRASQAKRRHQLAVGSENIRSMQVITPRMGITGTMGRRKGRGWSEWCWLPGEIWALVMTRGPLWATIFWTGLASLGRTCCAGLAHPITTARVARIPDRRRGLEVPFRDVMRDPVRARRARILRAVDLDLAGRVPGLALH